MLAPRRSPRAARLQEAARPAGRVPAVDAPGGALPEGREVLRGSARRSSASASSRSPPTTTTRSRSRRSRTRSTQGAKVLVIQPTDSPGRVDATSGSRTSTARRSSRTTARSSSPDLDYYVSHDSYRSACSRRRPRSQATGGKGKYVILAGQAGHSVATEITRGYKDTLAPYVARGDIEIVARAEPQRVVARAGAAHRRGRAHAHRRPHRRDPREQLRHGARRGPGDHRRGPRRTCSSPAPMPTPRTSTSCARASRRSRCSRTSSRSRRPRPTSRSSCSTARCRRAQSTIALAGKSVPVAAVRVEVVTRRQRQAADRRQRLPHAPTSCPPARAACAAK